MVWLCMRSVIEIENQASSPMKPSVTKSTVANSAVRSGDGFIRLPSSSTAMWVFLRVTTAPPMKASHIRP